MNFNYVSLLTSIFLVSFLLLVVEVSSVGCIASLLPRGLCDCFSHFVYSVTLIFTSISHLWNDNEKRKWANRFKKFQRVHWRVMNLYAGQIRSVVGWTLSRAHLDALCVMAHPNEFIRLYYISQEAS